MGWRHAPNATVSSSGGSVAVECRVNEDPRRLGYHLLGLPYESEVARSFPVVWATVSFAGEGYAGAMGWIQVLRYSGGGLGGERIEVDLPPQPQDSNTPYCFWGIQPTFFDAPSTPHEDVNWRAEAFLATSPDALMTRTAQPICGFR